jgi:hypothetical protein
MLLSELRSLGIRPGAVLLVHAALSKVAGSPAALSKRCSRPLARLRRHETVFLHPPGVCGECDVAHAGMR